jgi:hypothetical protein
VDVKGAVEAARPTGAHTILLNSLTATCLWWERQQEGRGHIEQASGTVYVQQRVGVRLGLPQAPTHASLPATKQRCCMC